MRIRGALVFTIVLVGMFAKPAKGMPASEILDHVDDLYRGHTSYVRMTLRIVTRHFSRELTVDQWNKGPRYFLVRVLSPPKDKGTALLRSGSELWTYLPKIARTMKLPPELITCNAWLGSHFTSDDLMKYTRLSRDYFSETTFEGEREGERQIEFTLTPKPEANLFWGKLVLVVRQADKLPVRLTYFDEDLKPARTMRFADIRKLGDRTLPTRMRVEPTDKPDEFSEIRYQQIVFDEKIGDSFFSLSTLEKSRE